MSKKRTGTDRRSAAELAPAINSTPPSNALLKVVLLESRARASATKPLSTGISLIMVASRCLEYRLAKF